MASMPAPPSAEEKPPTSANARDARQPTPHAKTRAERFAEAHAWVLEHHAGTFAKLAK